MRSEVSDLVKSRTNGKVRESEVVINEADKKVIVCEAVNCFVKATTTIEVDAGHRTISLSLCNICVSKFVGDDGNC
jgi:hypothetical protein